MARLEELTRGASVRGILPDGLVAVVDVRWHGSAVVELTYKDATGRLGNELLYRDSEPGIEVIEAGRPWSFNGTAASFAWSRGPTGSTWPTSSTRSWPSIRIRRGDCCVDATGESPPP
jgi:hypothetical protein